MRFMKGKIIKIILIIAILGLISGFFLKNNNLTIKDNHEDDVALSKTDQLASDDLLYTKYWNDSSILKSEFVESIAYLACGYNGLVIVNLSEPLFPQEISTINNYDFYFDMFAISDNILYCYNDSIIYFFNITILNKPSLISSYFDFERLHGLDVQDKIGYLSCENLTTSKDELQILNLTNPLNITLISSFDYYDNQIYWPYQDIIESNSNLIVLTSSTSDKFHFLNKTDLLNITRIITLTSKSLFLISDLKVLAINYTQTLSEFFIYDISNTSNITILSSNTVNGILSYHYQKNDQLIFSEIGDYDLDSKITYNNWYSIFGELPISHIYQINAQWQLSLNKTINYFPIQYNVPYYNENLEIYHPFEKNYFYFQNIIFYDEIAYLIGNAKLYIASSDEDRDMVLDFMEESLGLDTNNDDSDSDFLDDGLEFFIYKTDPINPDTDGDGISDGVEIYLWNSDPLDNKSGAKISGIIQAILLFVLLITLPLYAIYVVISIILKDNEKNKMILIKESLFLGIFLCFTIPFLWCNIIASQKSISISEITLNGHWIEYLFENPQIALTGVGDDLGNYNPYIPLFAYLSIAFIGFGLLVEIILLLLKNNTESDKRKAVFDMTLKYKNIIIILGSLFAMICCSLLLVFYFQIKGGFTSQFDRPSPLFFNFKWPFWLFLIAQVFVIIYLALQPFLMKIKPNRRNSDEGNEYEPSSQLSLALRYFDS
ncbi:MAG: hypothetical protein FK734_08205 [Asgard group archaeon]|nr:hypothetical protein [Asgard group archaeon]